MSLKAISLFTGVGGLDFGTEAAGFKTTAAVEMDKAACRSLGQNRHWSLLQGDIHEISSRSILDKAGFGPGDADLLTGGPPCQPFSKSGYWASGDALRLDDPRAGTLGEYLRVLSDIRPRAFLLENVPGLAFSGKAEGLEFLKRGIELVNKEARTNYSFSWAVLNAADYGVPQTRERVFIVGSRDGEPFTFPSPTHRSSDVLSEDIGNGLEPYMTAWDAIGDLPRNPRGEDGLKVGGKWGDLLPSIPEGENYLFHTNRGQGYPLFGWRKRYWSFLLKLAKVRPSWTIQAQPGPHIGPFHWANRRLTALEMCRLQTFPENIDLDFSRNQVQRLLGNAVPSLLVEVLGCAIRDQLLKAPRTRKTFRLLPSRNQRRARRESIGKMPEKYWSLIGEHEDHPGEGKGPRARAVRDALHASPRPRASS
ncbi:MAG: DNA (cytosine-5-)-methyltransferase [bacterium]|nr:DNA (cytosine-5-)-methyltransferase [bacterium]